MSTVESIFTALGGLTPIATETGIPIQTVCDWKKNGNIPHWRRDALLDMAKRKGIELDPALIAYLVSRDRARAA